MISNSPRARALAAPAPHACDHGPRRRARRMGLVAAAAALLLAGAGLASAAHADAGSGALIVTASNATLNQLLVFNSAGTLLETIPTQGQGGVAGNAGGIAAWNGRVAVVNFGSNNVSVFARDKGLGSLHLEQVIPTHGSPVSVAFGENHLYVLTTTQVESHPARLGGVASAADGVVPLLHADGSAAQVGVMTGQLVVSEKSNAIETMSLDAAGAVSGPATLVADIPANVDAPFGLVTRGDEAYVTIAHADEISLVRNNAVLTVTPSVSQHAPCWLALDGPFLFSSNSPSKTVSRYAVYGQHVVQDAAVVAQFNGSPTDIAYNAGLAAVIDSNGTQSHVSVFKVDEDGNFSLSGAGTLNSKTTNGVVVLASD